MPKDDKIEEAKKEEATKLFIRLMDENNLVIKASAVPVDTTSQGQVIIGCQISVDYKK